MDSTNLMAIRRLFFKLIIPALIVLFTMSPSAHSAETDGFIIKICHGGFIPLDHAHGMLFPIAVISNIANIANGADISDTSNIKIIIKDLTIDTKWWDLTNTLHYKYVDNKSIATEYIGCQDTPDTIYITGAVGIIDGVKYNLIKNIRVVKPKEVEINSGGYRVLDLIVRPE